VVSSNIHSEIGPRWQPGELAHNESKIALNRGKIRARLIGLTQRQRVVGAIGEAGHITACRFIYDYS